MRTLIHPAAIVCALGAAIAPAQAASVADWRHDLDLLVRHVRLTHPDPFNRVGELTFLRAVQALEEDLPRLGEEQRVVRVMRIMATLGDAHSIVEPRTDAFAAWYPIRIVEFTDGYFITSAHESIADLAGARVLEIAGRPVTEIAEAGRDLLGADNEYWRRETLYPLLNAGVMKGLGYAAEDGSITLRVRLRSGRTIERRLSPRRAADAFSPDQSSFDWRFGRTDVSGPTVAPSAEYVSAFRGLRADLFRTTRDTSRPLHFSHRTLNAVAVPEHDAYYIMINVWHGNQQESIPQFFARAMREVDQQRPRRLVIDLRLNVGGDGSNALPVLRELLARQQNQPWRELYVLTSGRTYSASINFIGPLLQNLPVTLVGEPVGGALNLYGDYSTFQLARTGLELRVSALRHQLSSSDDIRTVLPVDVPAPFSFADYIAGRDPAIDPILAGEEMRGIPIIARADGGGAARGVYRERLARFGDTNAWAPPTEVELRAAGNALEAEGRMADAIETYRLSTEIRPSEWRTWINLAIALREDGQIAAALEAYRQCIALNDPTNFNQVDITDRVIPELESQLAQQSGAAQ